MSAYFASLTAWIQANPVLFTVVLWPIFSGVVLALFKPRTPEAYAKMNPYVAGFLTFLSGTGWDPRKALQGLFRMLTGKSIPISAARARDLLQQATVVETKPPIAPATTTTSADKKTDSVDPPPAPPS